LKEQFYKWWLDNGQRGRDYCLANCNIEGLTRWNVQKWLKDFRTKQHSIRIDEKAKSLAQEIKKYSYPAKQEVTIIQAGCLHFPKHDEKFVGCLLQVAEYIKPDYGVLTGDIADNSKHSKHNTALSVLMTEALKGKSTLRKFLQDFKSKCKSVKYIRGNHEAWIDDQKESNIELMYNSEFTVPKVLGFDDLEIDYFEDLWEYQDFVFKHGDSIATGDNAPKTEFFGELRNGASSHTHRSGRYRHTTRTKQYVWYTTGCGCQLNMWYKLKGKSKINSGWNHSFNVFKFIGKQFQCTQVEVIDGQCIYDNKLFIG